MMLEVVLGTELVYGTRSQYKATTVLVRLGSDLSLNRTWACQPRYFHTCLTCKQDLVQSFRSRGEATGASKGGNGLTCRANRNHVSAPLARSTLCKKLTKDAAERAGQPDNNQTLRASPYQHSTHRNVSAREISSSPNVKRTSVSSLHQTHAQRLGIEPNHISDQTTHHARARTRHARTAPPAPCACQQIGARRSADGGWLIHIARHKSRWHLGA